MAAAIAAETACFTDWRTVLAPGEVATVAVIAGDRAQARTVFRYVRALISETSLLAGMIVNETAERLELNNRSNVEVFTASSVRVRGYTIACAVLDEIAYWPTDGAVDPDTEILAALRPAMATVRGARLIAISSPYARRGELFKAHAKNYGQPGARKLIWQCATRTMNSTVSAETVALALEEDFERARSEWLGEFQVRPSAPIHPRGDRSRRGAGPSRAAPAECIEVFRFRGSVRRFGGCDDGCCGAP